MSNYVSKFLMEGTTILCKDSEARATLATKANQSAVDSLSQNKADKSSLQVLASEVAGKASQSSVTALTAEVSTKASSIQLGIVKDDLDTLEARVDELTELPEGSTAGDAELADIRIGYDGTTYPNAGTAVRTQVSDLHDDVNKTVEDIFDSNSRLAEYVPITYVQGNTPPDGGANVSSDTRITASTMAEVKSLVADRTPYILVIGTEAFKYRVTFYSVRSQITSNLVPSDSNTYWHQGANLFEVPATAEWFKVSIAMADDSDIIPTDASTTFVYRMYKKDSEYYRNVGKRISILGDSVSTYSEGDETDPDGHYVSEGTYMPEGNHSRYPYGNVTGVNATWWGKLCYNLGLQLGVNDSWANTRISWDGTESSDAGVNKYIGAQARINKLDDNGLPDFIFIEGGYNDIINNVSIGEVSYTDVQSLSSAQIAQLPVATFADAFKALLLKVLETYKQAKVFVLIPSFTQSYNNATLNNYAQVMIDYCKFLGVEYIDLREAIPIRNVSGNTVDGLHPNQSGMIKIYDLVRAKICEDYR